MPKATTYTEHVARYDSWYDNHPAEYTSELDAVRQFVPAGAVGCEIGVGTARFAAPLGVKVGVDPSLSMLSYAVKRNINSVAGVAESLPFKDQVFDYALMVTTLCVLEEPDKAVIEAHRVIKIGGCFVVGFLDFSSRFASEYVKRHASSPFAQGARFRTAAEVERYIKMAGFTGLSFVQTLFNPLENLEEPEKYRNGYGDGLFAVAKALKS